MKRSLSDVLSNYRTLAFPVGRAPGVDLGHIAFNGVGNSNSLKHLVLSAVANPAAAGFLRLNNTYGTDPNLGTQSGSATAGVDKAIGSFWNSATSGGAQKYQWAMSASTIGNVALPATLAVICRPTSTATSLALSIGASSGIAVAGLVINTTGTCVDFNFGNQNNNFTSLVVTANQPYLMIVSVVAALGVMNGLLLNLATGKVLTQTLASSAGGGNCFAGGNINIGNWVLSNTLSFPGSIAAAMIIPKFMSINDMLVWAQDPWSFWYPTVLAPSLYVGATVNVAGVGNADGSADVAGVGVTARQGAGAADGSASVAGVSAANAAAAGQAGGSASVSGVSVAARLGAGEADGSADVEGRAIASAPAVGNADGSADVEGVGVSGTAGAGQADGSSTVVGVSETVLPDLPAIGFPVHRRPHWRTVIGDHLSGGENRTALWTYPLWEFEITFEGLSASATQFPNLGAKSYQTLLGFYLICGGQFTPFLFNDPIFNTQVAGPVGVGDGATVDFFFMRQIGETGSGAVSVEPASYVISPPAPVVYFDGVVQSSGWSIVQPNNLVFDSPPGDGVVITADFSYRFLCRFIEDTGDYEQFMINLFTMKSLKFRQVRTT